MTSDLEIACLDELRKICPKGFVVAINIDNESPEWVSVEYPLAWLEYYAKNNLIETDPTIDFAKRGPGWISWVELERDFPDAAVWVEAEKFGLREGNTMAIRVDGVHSMISGAGVAWNPTNRRIIKSALTSLHVLHVKKPNLEFPYKILLVLQLMAAGKRDQEIADELGLKIETIRSRRRAAQKLTGTKTPAELMVYVTRKAIIY